MKRYKNSTMTLFSVLVIGLILAVGREANADFTLGEPNNLGTPVNLGPLFPSSGQYDVDPSISSDGLSLYFASDRIGGRGDGDLWVTTRETTEDLWGEPVNLGPKVNSGSGDYCPRLSVDGLTLYFHSWRSGGLGGSDLWMTTRADLEAPWENPVNLGSKINTSASEQDASISADGLTLYFDRGQTRIYQATRASLDVPWSGAVVTYVNLNTTANDCHPCISADGLSLYFASSRAGGFGAMDLYVTTRDSIESPWGQPQNLGDAINTPYGQYGPSISSDGLTLYYDESGNMRMVSRESLAEAFGEPQCLSSSEGRAQLSSDGLSLYFASDRPGGLGYQDIWVATRESVDDPWQEPVNLGPAINSNDWDWSPCISFDGLELYFASEHGCSAEDWDLMVSTRATTDDPWSPAVNLGTMVNSAVGEDHPAISADGLTLIFGSDREGGSGKSDLWMTQRESLSDPWAQPVNLGAYMNSSVYESSPSLSTDGRWLFFNRYDPSNPKLLNQIMVSALGPDGKWSRPRNLANIANLPIVASGPAISPDDCTLYFLSDIPEGIGGVDIWKMDLLPIVDFNGDGQVDDSDVSLITNHLGETETMWDIGPTPLGDGIVDEQDLAVIQEYLDMEFIDSTLAAHWALDEVEGTVAQNDVRDKHGTLKNGPVWQPEGGAIDGALQFDGEDDYVSAPFVLNPYYSPFSVFVWVKGGAPGQVILSQGLGVSWLLADSDGNLMTELKAPGAAGETLGSQVNITDGNWHRVGFVRDGTNRILYVDDVEVARDNPTSLSGNVSGLYIGTSNKLTEGTFWSGLIDDVRIYNRVITP